jgi:hypothetical protein
MTSFSGSFSPSSTFLNVKLLTVSFSSYTEKETLFYKEVLHETIFTATQLSAVTVIFCTWE